MRRYFKTILIVTFCFSQLLAYAQKPYNHTAPAKGGDIIHTYLKRYLLSDHRCNFKEFYKLNNLHTESQLREGKIYKLPIKIHKFDNKTIRTSLKLKEDYVTAFNVKKYNEAIKKKGHRKKTIVDSKIIWVPHHLLNCPASINNDLDSTDELEHQHDHPEPPQTETKEEEIVEEVQAPPSPPVSTGPRHFTIFGKDHAHIPLQSNKLRHKIFYIVSGHGGPDSGAVGQRGNHQLCEDEYAYDVSLRLVRNLLEHGAIVYMITRDENDGLRSGRYLKCDRDETCWGGAKLPWNQKKRLIQRTEAVNELYYKHHRQGLKDQTVISVHIDSRSVSQSADVFFYYMPDSKKGKRRAMKMHDTMKKKYRKHRADGSYKGTVTARDLHMLRETKPTSVYVELGNIRNPNDQKRFILESNRQALADWLYEGLIR